MTALSLAVLAVLLAWPVPLALARARWVRRAPAAAMVLWQAVALAGGLAMIGTPLAWGLAPFGDTLPRALSVAVDSAADGGWLRLLTVDDMAPARIAAVTLALILAIHLLLTLGVTAVRTVRERQRHRRLIELLADPSERSRLERDTRVLPHDAPVAYCLPGLVGGLTVVSRGLLERLSDTQVSAVVAHERAHAHQRHDLLRLAFDAWQRACPWLPTTRVAQCAVSSLTEMLADDEALKEHRREDLVAAMALTGSSDLSPEPPDKDTEQAVPVTLRLYRLLSPTPSVATPLQVGVVTASAVLACTPLALLLIG